MTAELDPLGGARRAFPNFHVIRLARTVSTQDVVRRAARAGAAEGYCCVADEQTAGRGRLGRRWLAEPGTALLVSVLVRPRAAVAGGVPIAAGLAVADALSTGFEVEARLKWPNDVMAGTGKLAGILAEVEPSVAGRRHVAVALGLGLNLSVPAFPPSIAGASLHRLTAEPVDRDTVLGHWLVALAARLHLLDVGGVPALRGDWRRRALGLGETITAITGAGRLTGIAEDIDDSGALLVRTSEGVVPLVAGDVHIDAPPAG